ncbi:hypothetical protein DSECCO2_604100 [anaerobic digester metagenome]
MLMQVAYSPLSQKLIERACVRVYTIRVRANMIHATIVFCFRGTMACGFIAASSIRFTGSGFLYSLAALFWASFLISCCFAI